MKKSKKIIAFLLSVMICCSVCACSEKEPEKESTTDEAPIYEYVFKQMRDPVFVPAAESFDGGSGTESDPYLISDSAQLALFAKKANDTESDEFINAHYKLTEDIAINEGDAADFSTTAPKYDVEPVGASAHYFGGVFDGDGHTISGMYINRDSNEEFNKNAKTGFILDNKGVIKNLNIENSYICVSGYEQYTGVIAANILEDGVVENCTVDAIVECYDAKAGGIAGANNGTIKNCVFDGRITEVKDKALSSLGGIVGFSSGNISDCKFDGVITSGADDASYAGGIVGYMSDKNVENCINDGIINCIESENDDGSAKATGVRAGGIVGVLFSSSTGGEYANKDMSILNCENNGEVKGGMFAGGIAGEVNNSGSDYPVTISGCTNNAKLSSLDFVAGIVAKVSCTGDSVTIKDCVNKVDLTQDEAAGIVSSLSPTSGTVEILNCTNEGDISSENLYAGGIVSAVYYFSDVNSIVNIDGCTNTGKISTANSAGGILAYINSTGTTKVKKDTSLTVSNCVSGGEIYTTSNNAYVGGIIGGCGTKDMNVLISKCYSQGKITFDCPPPQEGTEDIEENRIKLTRMAGGIVGRIGESLFLSTSADEMEEKNINSEKAKIVVSDCASSCEFVAENEDKNKYKDGTPIFTNEFGGIIGNCSAEDGYSFKVENCSYVNPERGLGAKCGTDVGERISQSEFDNKTGGK